MKRDRRRNEVKEKPKPKPRTRERRIQSSDYKNVGSMKQVMYPNMKVHFNMKVSFSDC